MYIVSDDNCIKNFDRFQIRYEPLNLNRLQYFIDSGRIDPAKPINMHTLYWSGAVGKIEHGVKLLADVSVIIIREVCMGVG
jgi:large subunit ribosomal protein L15